MKKAVSPRLASAGSSVASTRQRSGDGGIGDEQLAPVQHVAIAAPDRGRADGGHVRPGLRLADGVAGDGLAAGEAGKVPELLLLAPEEQERHLARPDVGAQREQEPVIMTAVPEPLKRRDGIDDIELEAAIAARDAVAEHPDLGTRSKALAVPALGPV